MKAALDSLKGLPSAPAMEHSNGIGADWRDVLAPSKSGYIGDERNVLLALRHDPALLGLTQFDEFSLNIALTRPPPWRPQSAGRIWTEEDDTQALAYFQAFDIKVRARGAVADSVAVVARDHAFHPVREYLAALVWDAMPRLRTWAADYLGAVGNPAYLSAIGLRFLVSAIARIMQPGCQVDHVLVLEGPQGIGKTSAARELAVRPEWFAGNLPDIHSKDAPLQLIARWIIEIAELKGIRRSQIEATKSFITETADTFRPPYGRRTAQFPRQCVFIATTNESEYLRDPTGNRRYWPVRCGRIDTNALARDRDQLWAEALHLFRAGTAWHLTEAEGQLAQDEQRQRVHVTELEADVADYLAAQVGRDEVSVRDVLVYGLHVEPDKSYADTARKLGPAVAEAMGLAGWQKDSRSRQGGQKRTVYRRVDKVDKLNE
jgi:putative DNA primase/helicase